MVAARREIDPAVLIEGEINQFWQDPIGVRLPHNSRTTMAGNRREGEIESVGLNLGVEINKVAQKWLFGGDGGTDRIGGQDAASRALVDWGGHKRVSRVVGVIVSTVRQCYPNPT